MENSIFTGPLIQFIKRVNHRAAALVRSSRSYSLAHQFALQIEQSAAKSLFVGGQLRRSRIYRTIRVAVKRHLLRLATASESASAKLASAFSAALPVRLLLYITVALLPFLSPQALYLLTAFCLVSFLGRRKPRRLESGGWLPPLYLPFSLFALAVAVGAIFSINPGGSLKALGVQVCGAVLVLLIANSFRKERDFLLAGFFISIGAVLTALFAINTYNSGAIPVEAAAWTDPEIHGSLTRRAYAPFWGNPNLLASYMLFAAPMSASLMIACRGRFRQFFTLSTMLMLICLVLTWSRGGWVAGFSAWLAVSVLTRSRYVFFAGLAAGIVLALTSDDVVSRLASIGISEDTSNVFRVGIWGATWNMICDTAFFGVGLGRDAFVHAYGIFVTGAEGARHAHNLYLQIMAELGWPGLIAFVWLALAGIYACVKIRSSSGGIRPLLASGLAAALIAMLIHGVFDYTLWYFKLSVLFWFYIGIILGLEKAENEYEA